MEKPLEQTTNQSFIKFPTGHDVTSSCLENDDTHTDILDQLQRDSVIKCA